MSIVTQVGAYGQNMEVPLGAFLNGWQASDYELTVVTKNPVV